MADQQDTTAVRAVTSATLDPRVKDAADSGDQHERHQPREPRAEPSLPVRQGPIHDQTGHGHRDRHPKHRRELRRTDGRDTRQIQTPVRRQDRADQPARNHDCRRGQRGACHLAGPHQHNRPGRGDRDHVAHDQCPSKSPAPNMGHDGGPDASDPTDGRPLRTGGVDVGNFGRAPSWLPPLPLLAPNARAVFLQDNHDRPSQLSADFPTYAPVGGSPHPGPSHVTTQRDPSSTLHPYRVLRQLTLGVK